MQTVLLDRLTMLALAATVLAASAPRAHAQSATNVTPAASSAAGQVPAESREGYIVTALGVEARAIDAAGRVVVTQGTQASLFTPSAPNGATGSLAPLGTLGGSISIGKGINAAGHIAGYTTLANGHYRSFVFSGGVMTDIGSLSGDYSSATGINDGGQIVGFSYNATDNEHGYLWTPDVVNGTSGSMVDLGTLGGEYSDAEAVNADGVVVGYAYTALGAFHAFRYSGGAMTDLGTLGGAYSKADAINAQGQIVGQAYLPGNVKAHACLWDGAAREDLGNLGGEYSEALALDADGTRIVGEASVPDGGPYLVYHAFLVAHGTMRDLNASLPAKSGWVLQTAAGINEHGQIVGTGTLNGQQRGFLLTPK